MLCGLIEPRAARTTEGEATLLATACGALILCASLIIVGATAGIIEHVQTAIHQASGTSRRAPRAAVIDIGPAGNANRAAGTRGQKKMNTKPRAKATEARGAPSIDSVAQGRKSR